MNIPEDLRPHVIHATLIVASDHMHASFLLAGGDAIEQVDAIAMPREKRQDSEGYFRSSDSSRHGDPNADTSDEPRLSAFTKAVATRTAELIREQDTAHLHLVMPKEVERLVRQDLPQDATKKIVRVRNLDLMKEDPITILRRVYE
ncbi:host attachment protein [Patescibacteria group bacterium]|nr:host attachment protein [Patescibacteria group bacterium]MBU1448894.1 host attachment protein [Patescibacteria group bacterium]MBU2613300.1 host attachment protein [Patescibacteria group bacterium]